MNSPEVGKDYIWNGHFVSLAEYRGDKCVIHFVVDGDPHIEKVEPEELLPIILVQFDTAPTVERLNADYRAALDTINEMAIKIKALEESRDLWQAEALRLRATTDDIPF